MAEEPSLSYYLPIAGGRIIGFIPFPRVLVLCEMQSVSSRIWTRIAVLISYGDNDYTTGNSLVGGYPSAEVQSVYSTALADWANTFWIDRREKQWRHYFNNISIFLKCLVWSTVKI